MIFLFILIQSLPVCSSRSPTKIGVISFHQNHNLVVLNLVRICVWFILRSVMAILYHADWCVCAFERGKVGDVISSGCATTKIVLREKLLKAGKLCVVLRC